MHSFPNELDSNKEIWSSIEICPSPAGSWKASWSFHLVAPVR